MNLADGLNSQDNESSEDEGNQVKQSPNQPSGTYDENSDPSNHMEGSICSDTNMIASSVRRVQSADNTGVKKINYDLPEN